MTSSTSDFGDYARVCRSAREHEDSGFLWRLARDQLRHEARGGSHQGGQVRAARAPPTASCETLYGPPRAPLLVAGLFSHVIQTKLVRAPSNGRFDRKWLKRRRW